MGNFLSKLKYVNFKTIFYNFKLLPFEYAIHFPIFVSKNSIIVTRNKRNRGGGVVISSKPKMGMIKIGYFNTGIVDAPKERTKIRLEKGAVLIFKGNCSLGAGCRINVSSNGLVVFGDNFSATSRSTFYCNKKIEFGDDCLVSWDCLFMDTDSHKIFQDGKYINHDAEICIGNHVWIGCRSTILKGVSIANDSVIGAGAVVTKDCISEKCVYAGNPAVIVKSNVAWSKE